MSRCRSRVIFGACGIVSAAMCGIFGAVIGRESPMIRGDEGRKHLDRLFRLSASRGKEAAGLAIATDDSLSVFKQPVGALTMIRMPEFNRFVRDVLDRHSPEASRAFIGHSRLQTDGAREVNLNNQPVAGSGIVGIPETGQAFPGRHDEISWGPSTPS